MSVRAGYSQRARSGPAQAGSAWLPGSLVWRVAVLSIVVVFVQISVVSEVPVFGVSIDLSPLLVAFVGLLCGSTMGAVAGFCVGLLIDLALMQTLGVTSLTFTIIGYWAGRLRELRDPQAALTPLFVGAAAATAAMVGYSIIEFLLGVDAPVSLELLREIVVGVLVDTVGGAADVGAGAPLHGGGAARRSAPSPPPRVYDGRSQPAVTIQGRPVSFARPCDSPEPGDELDRAPTPERAAWRGGWAFIPPAGVTGRDPGQHRARHVRDHLLSPVVSAGAERRTVRPAGPGQRPARTTDTGPARGDPRQRRPADRD